MTHMKADRYLVPGGPPNSPPNVYKKNLRMKNKEMEFRFTYCSSEAEDHEADRRANEEKHDRECKVACGRDVFLISIALING